MIGPVIRTYELTEVDLDFLIDIVAPDTKNPEAMKRMLREDEKLRDAMVSDDRVFQKVITDEESMLRISPALYFELLLHGASKEIEVSSYTFERSGRKNIPVFDAREVGEFLLRPGMLHYLANMLSSFTRIHGYVMVIRVRPGVQRRIRYNDMDIDSLIRLASHVEEEHRLGLYKRIADVCLFISGVFPDHTTMEYNQSESGETLRQSWSATSRTTSDYEREGRLFYGLAEEHPSARDLALADIFGVLRQNFTLARKPLLYISSKYLHSRQQQLFGAPA